MARPAVTACTAVPSGAETSTPVWNDEPPWSPIRGSWKKPRTGCWWSNGSTGHGYGAIAIPGACPDRRVSTRTFPLAPAGNDAAMGDAPEILVAHADRVRLSVPAGPSFRGALRLLLGGLGNSSGLSYDEVNELQLAVEALIASRTLAGDSLLVEADLDDGAMSLAVGPFVPRGRSRRPARARPARAPGARAEPRRRRMDRARGGLPGGGRARVVSTEVRLERRRLLEAFKRDGDLAARDQLIADLMPLVRSLALRYQGRGESIEDLVQVGQHRADQGRRPLRPRPRRRADDVRRPDDPRRDPAPLPRQGVGGARAAERQGAAAPARPAPRRHVRRARPVAHDRGAREGGRLRRGGRDRGARVRPGVHRAEPLGADRRRGRRHAVPISWATSDSGYAHVEVDSLVVAGLDALEPRERRIVELRFFAGLTQSQIAAEIGISQMHVSRLLRAALQTMRGRIEDDLGGEP